MTRARGCPRAILRGCSTSFSVVREEGTIIGVGLGLAICRTIIQAHGGSIEARRRPGGGAQFEFTLPATEPGA